MRWVFEEKHAERSVLASRRGRFAFESQLPGFRIAKSGRLRSGDAAKGTWGTPIGIDAGLKQFLPDVVLIEAFRDPSAEAVGKSTAALGRLLRQILEPLKAQISASVGDAIATAGRIVNTIEVEGREVDDRPEELRRVEERVRKNIRALFASSDVRLRFQLPGVPELLSSATVELRDGGPWTAPDGKGQGFQRVMYFALLRAIAEELRQAPKKMHRPFLLLYEEPEAFLHPALQRQMGDALETIAESNQVVIATHSPILVTPDRLESVLVVRQPETREGKETTATKLPSPRMVCLRKTSSSLPC
jgi:predicted ATP-dependent endonuclease of OLD family